MDNTNQNMPTSMSSMGGLPPEKKSHGPLIAVIVILFLIVIGGLYFLGQRMDNDYTLPAKDTVDTVTESMNNQDNSDEVSSIEADINATNIDNVDQGAAVIESEL